MKKTKFKILAIILSIVLIILISLNIYINYNKPLYTHEIEIKFQVSDFFGLIINETSLDFGAIIHQTGNTKTVILTNEISKNVLVKVSISPELENFIFGKGEFTLKPYEKKEYPVTLFIPEDADFGEYTGKIIFEFYKKD